MENNESTHTPKRVTALAVFLILFGIVFAILTFATIMGPVLGLLILAFGIYLLWKSAKGEPPETLP